MSVIDFLTKNLKVLNKVRSVPTVDDNPGIYFRYSDDGKQRGIYIVSNGTVYTIFDAEEFVADNSAYNVLLSSYSGVHNKTASTVTLFTKVSATKGASPLEYALEPAVGKFTVTTEATGCTCEVKNGSVNILTITADTNASVVIKVNCENVETITQTYSISVVANGSSQNGTNGSNGSDGSDGKTMLPVYKLAEERPATPTGDTYPPSGWATDPPTGQGNIWMSQALFNSNGSWGNGSWSTPILFTSNESVQGADGPFTVFRGAFDAAKAYIGSSERRDIVKSGSTYYIAKKTAGVFSGQTPSGSSAYWDTFQGNYESVATELLFAEYANIAGWVFRNDRIESQHNNVILNGQADTKPKIAAGAAWGSIDNAAFRVYEDGRLYASNAEISGKINASTITGGTITGGTITGGTITGGTINGARLTCNGTYYGSVNHMIWGVNNLGTISWTQWIDATAGYDVLPYTPGLNTQNVAQEFIIPAVGAALGRVFMFIPNPGTSSLSFSDKKYWPTIRHANFAKVWIGGESSSYSRGRIKPGGVAYAMLVGTFAPDSNFAPTYTGYSVLLWGDVEGYNV